MQRIPEKLQKANESRKGQIKGQGLNNSNFGRFFMSSWSFGVDNAHILSFSSFKVIKAALIAGVAFLQMGLFIFSKVLLYHPEEIFKAPLTQNRAEKLRLRILKTKTYNEGRKIEEHWEIFLNKINA